MRRFNIISQHRRKLFQMTLSIFAEEMVGFFGQKFSIGRQKLRQSRFFFVFFPRTEFQMQETKNAMRISNNNLLQSESSRLRCCWKNYTRSFVENKELECWLKTILHAP